jgi:hypothetical protein
MKDKALIFNSLFSRRPELPPANVDAEPISTAALARTSRSQVNFDRSPLELRS